MISSHASETTLNDGHRADLDFDQLSINSTIKSQLGYSTWTHAENGGHFIGYTDEHGTLTRG